MFLCIFFHSKWTFLFNYLTNKSELGVNNKKDNVNLYKLFEYLFSYQYRMGSYFQNFYQCQMLNKQTELLLIIFFIFSIFHDEQYSVLNQMLYIVHWDLDYFRLEDRYEFCKKISIRITYKQSIKIFINCQGNNSTILKGKKLSQKKCENKLSKICLQIKEIMF